MLKLDWSHARVIVLICFIAGAAGFACLILPRLILGENSLIDPLDYFDSVHAWKTLLARTGETFAAWNAQVPMLFDTGVPRVSLGAQFDVLSVVYLVLSPYWATVALELVARAIGFWGMYRLVTRQLLSEREDRIAIAVVAATCFSLINYVPASFLSVIGLPLLLSSLIAIATRSATPFDYVYVLLFPFASSLPLVGVFVLAVLGVACLGLFLARRSTSAWTLVGAGCVMAIGYAIADYGIIAMKLLGGFETHRLLRAPRDLSVPEFVIAVVKSFVTGRFHVNSSVSHWLFLVCLAGAAVEWLEQIRGGTIRSLLRSPARWLSVIPVTCCLAAIFLMSFLAYLPSVALHYYPALPAVNEFNFSRWLWLTPPLYYLAFGLSVVLLASASLRYTVIPTAAVAAVLLLPQFFVLIRESTIPSRLIVRLATPAHASQLSPAVERVVGLMAPPHRELSIGLTYREYYSPHLFDVVEQILGAPRATTRVATIGADPFIANYNGFPTTEGYFQLLPLSYHARLRRVQEAELTKNAELSSYFNEWGNRAYLFSSDLYGEGSGCRTHCLADRAPARITLAYDPEALRDLSITALLSVSEIANAEALGLELAGVAQDDASPWRFFVYRLTNPAPSSEPAT